MYDDDLIKGNRDSIEGKQIVGRKDIIISDGSEGQNFTLLAYRIYRYIGIEPRPGQIKQIGGHVPHPEGEIKVYYDFGKAGKADIKLPRNISGEFVWKGRRYQLHGGENKLHLK